MQRNSKEGLTSWRTEKAWRKKHIEGSAKNIGEVSSYGDGLCSTNIGGREEARLFTAPEIFRGKLVEIQVLFKASFEGR